ncbi:septal ring lytic transglycosylase RlpA family protein [Deltaproteobacteria bacterium OttesenSCG-928-M10]|nr:septal ring lytic transglycosylase RlpA family protein [Deltaproteobacteria bacterium OttesenSCG-928-M10]
MNEIRFRKFSSQGKLWLSLICLVAAVGLAGCGAKAPRPADKPEPPQAEITFEADEEEAVKPARATTSSYVVGGRRYHVLADAAGFTEEGLAAWYGKKFHGRKTASGEKFDMHKLTAAHKTLPFGTMVEVRSLTTGKTVVVRVNDRGPFSRGHIIDLSKGAAEKIGLKGTGPVTIRAVGK